MAPKLIMINIRNNSNLFVMFGLLRLHRYAINHVIKNVQPSRAKRRIEGRHIQLIHNLRIRPVQYPSPFIRGRVRVGVYHIQIYRLLNPHVLSLSKGVILYLVANSFQYPFIGLSLLNLRTSLEHSTLNLTPSNCRNHPEYVILITMVGNDNAPNGGRSHTVRSAEIRP